MKLSQIPKKQPVPVSDIERHLSRVGLTVGGDLFNGTLHIFTNTGQHIPITAEKLEGNDDYAALIKEIARLGSRLQASKPRKPADLLNIDDFSADLIELCKRHNKHFAPTRIDECIEIEDGFIDYSKWIIERAVKRYKDTKK